MRLRLIGLVLGCTLLLNSTPAVAGGAGGAARTSITQCTYCSFTQGGWGGTPHGDNVAALLAANFGTVYPSGVEVGIPGASGFSMLFTSSSAVGGYLPAGGTPGVLTADLVDPVTSPSGVFGGQVLALQINVDFSAAGLPEQSHCNLGDLHLCNTGGSLDGQTISQILAVANIVLGGGPLPAGYTVSTLNDLITHLNESFDNCHSTDWSDDHLCPPSCTAPVVTDPHDSGACPGSSVSFSVTATGTPTITYHWRKNTVPLTDGGNISGATTATLTINPATAADDGTYDVVATNDCGSDTSAGATLTVDTADADGDGTPNCSDGCPNDPNKIDPGTCGCGVADSDSDGDGTADCLDGCPNDPNKVDPGTCGCGVADTDSDGDGTADCFDGCPNDPNKVSPGYCGCGVADTDSDGDGTPDCLDGCPSDPNKISPGTCGCGVADTDSDGDGTLDCNDGCPNDPKKTSPGQCGCGVSDTDSDGDGTADCNDGCPNDPNKTSPGACGCGVADVDTDGDGVFDCHDNCPTIPNAGQQDTDGDGIGDACDNCPTVQNGDQADCDHDGIGDACENQPDCNQNGIPDSCDIANGTSHDNNSNGIPDECEDPVTSYCFGDGSQVPCPCGNNGSPGNGCANSDHPGGAHLAASGVPSLALDTLVMTATDLHGSSLVMLVQGDAQVSPKIYGDGIRCIGGHLKRMFKVKNSGAETVVIPSIFSIPSSPMTISGQSAALGDPLSPGDIRYYQMYYRDPVGSFCPPATFNITNALTVIWQP